MSIVKHGRDWKVIDAEGALICLTVYKARGYWKREAGRARGR